MELTLEYWMDMSCLRVMRICLDQIERAKLRDRITKLYAMNQIKIDILEFNEYMMHKYHRGALKGQVTS